jgi:hypothetical protein
MRYEIQSEAGDGINGTIYSTENAAIAAVKAHFGEECSVISSTGSGDPDGSGDSLTMSNDDDTEVADIVTIPGGDSE